MLPLCRYIHAYRWGPLKTTYKLILQDDDYTHGLCNVLFSSLLLTQVNIEYVPILLGALFKQIGTPNVSLQ